MTTPVTALARRWRLEVDLSAPKDGTGYALCPAITEFKWTAEPNYEESTTYDTDGWEEHDKTAQGWEVEVKFNRKVSADSTAYNPVHEALRTAFFAYGEDSKVRIRFMDRNGLPEAYEGYALVTWEPSGGEANELDQVEVKLKGTGALTPITNPLTP